MPVIDVGALRVLVVEDGFRVREVVRSLLQALGAGVVIEAAGQPESAEILRRAPVDLVIVHCHPEDSSGVDVVRHIRSIEENAARRVPIILACDARGCCRAAREAGANAVVAEPISARELMATIDVVVGTVRPFVRTANYVGPDRRCENLPVDPDRRSGQSNLIGQASIQWPPSLAAIEG